MNFERHNILQHRLLLALRWLCYALLLAFCYMLQTNRTLFTIGGIRPLWLPAAALVLSVFEDAFPCALYGLFAGLLWDFSSNRLAGFFAVLLLICCFLCSSVTQLLLRRTVLNTALLSLLCLFVMTGIDYLFTYALFSLPQRGAYYVGTLLPILLYTAAACMALYPLCRAIGRIGREDV